MQYQTLPIDAQNTIKAMVAFCVEHGYCMTQGDTKDAGGNHTPNALRESLTAFAHAQNGTPDNADAIIDNIIALNEQQIAQNTALSMKLLPRVRAWLSEGDTASAITLLNTLPACPTRMMIAGLLADHEAKTAAPA
jgi:hypothetical protein